MIPAALMYPALVQLVDEEHLLLRVLDASPPALQRISSVAGRAARATSSVAGRSLSTCHSTLLPAALDAGAVSAVVCEHLLTRHCTQSPATARWPSATYGVNWCQCHRVRCGTGRRGRRQRRCCQWQQRARDAMPAGGSRGITRSRAMRGARGRGGEVEVVRG